MRGMGQITAVMVGHATLPLIVSLTRSWITPEGPGALVSPQAPCPSTSTSSSSLMMFPSSPLSSSALISSVDSLLPSDPPGASDESTSSQPWRKKTQTEAGSGRNVNRLGSGPVGTGGGFGTESAAAAAASGRTSRRLS